MADDGFQFSTLFADDDSDDEKLAMDIESFLSVLDEDCVPSESSPEDSSLKDVSPGESGIHDDFLLQNGNSLLDSEHENQGPSSRTCSSPNVFAGGYRDSFSVAESDETCYAERAGVSEHEMPSYSVGTSSNPSLWKDDDYSQIKHVVDDVESEYASHSSIIENVDGTFEDYGTALKDTIGVSRQPENDSCTSFEMPFVDVDIPTHFGNSADSTFCQGSNVPSDFSGYYSSLNCYQGIDVRPVVTGSSGYFPNGVGSEFWKNEEPVRNMKVEKTEFLTDTTNMIGGMDLSTIGRIPFHDSQFMPVNNEYPSFFPGNAKFEDGESVQQSSCVPYISSEGQSFNVKAEGDEMVMPYQNTFHNDNAGLEVKQLPDIFPTTGYQNYDFFKVEDSDALVTTEDANYYQDLIGETANKFPGNMGNLNFRSLDKSLSIARASIANGNQYNCSVSELESKPSECKSIDSQLSKRSTEGSNDEDDCDVCIIEDISHPAPTSRSAEFNSLNMSQSSRFDYTQPYMAGGTRPKARDEQYILRAALQDISQPKSEVTPPDGLLAVSLLRHQKIALSWMVQKETSSLYCSGGILADDQGLGKTVSTIALILKERPPLLKTCNNAQKSVLQTMDLDDDPLPENGLVKKESTVCQDASDRNATTSANLSVHAKGRPSAGTLVVCPTSVLRQWADELHNKVTCKANLSVLVYHGSSRTKDPYELAKYDVVLTTYSIVSMEVPKQPLVDKDDKDDKEKGIYEDHPVPNRKIDMAAFLRRVARSTPIGFGAHSKSSRSNFHLPFTAIAAISGGFSYLYYSSSPNLVHSDQIGDEDIKTKNIALIPDKWVEFKLQDTARVSHDTHLYRFSFDPTKKLGLDVASCILTRAPFGQDAEEKPKYVIRPYTPISDTESKGYFDLLIKVYPEGKMSQHFASLKPGDVVEVKGPIEKFKYTPNMKKNIGMIAGGSGITPMLQVIEAILKNSDDKTQISLIYANVSPDDILLQQKLDILAKSHPNLKVFYTVDNPTKTWKGGAGYISKDMVVKGLPAPSDDTLVLVCGPPGMMQHISGEKAKDWTQGEVSGILKEAGYTEQMVYKF